MTFVDGIPDQYLIIQPTYKYNLLSYRIFRWNIKIMQYKRLPYGVALKASQVLYSCFKVKKMFK